MPAEGSSISTDSNLSPIYLDVFRASLVENFGFQPDLEHFTIGGVCQECHNPKSPYFGVFERDT